MDIKLIALDMDGTLLDSDHATVSARNLTALRAAAEQGAEIVIASGRTWSLVEDIARGMGVVRYVLISNGAAILDIKTGEWLFEAGIPHDQCREIIRILHAYDAPFEVFCGGQDYLERRYATGALQYTLSPEYAALAARRVRLVDEAEEAVTAGRTVEKFHVFHVEPEQRQPILDAVAATGPFESACAYTSNLEITAPEADKGAALRFLCGRLGIGAEQVMAFGDADNDLGMLSWAAWSFAMGNATERAKAAARHITLTNRDSGVAAAVEQYVLGQ